MIPIEERVLEAVIFKVSFTNGPAAASMYRDFPVLKPGLNAVSRFVDMTGILIFLRPRTI